uniref:Non-contractile tail fiber protein n=1 Tax=Pseudomonas phage PMBT23 TaxID=3137284 RepID=A0AAU8BTM6_9VIRU
MATTPKTVRTYPINSATKDFTIPFEYLARKFVVVTLIGATRRELILNTEYRFSTPTTITTTKAWGPSDNFNLIEIRRLTSATERLVDFADGSILRAYDLNISSVQSLHIAEEARDLTADTIGVNNDGNLDARARKIVNLADGVEDGDAVNLRQQKQWAGSTLNQAQAAAASAQAAANSSAAALSSANNSAGSASSSLTYSQNSANSASASQTSRLASETAKTAAETARDLSQAWSSKAEDSVVSGGLYSSYHYSRKSAASATASQNSATNASAYAGAALLSKNAAANSASVAEINASTVLSHIASYGANPVGTIVMALKDALLGHLPLNGATFDQTEYPELYEYLGTNVLPDWRGRYLKGADGTNLGTFAAGDIPAHTHTTPNHTHTGSTESAGSHTHTGSTESAGSHRHGVYASGNSTSYGRQGTGSGPGDYNATTALAGDHVHSFVTSSGGAHTHAVTISAGGGGNTGSAGTGTKVETDRIHVNFFIKAKGLAQA